ncbi:MAG: hypothetical protein KGI80_03635 [Verrucomicrobiota bacterium]|nr:hypothetical protein [Verrucomicrobiota bacterium]
MEYQEEQIYLAYEQVLASMKTLGRMEVERAVDLFIGTLMCAQPAVLGGVFQLEKNGLNGLEKDLKKIGGFRTGNTEQQKRHMKEMKYRLLNIMLVVEAAHCSVTEGLLADAERREMMIKAQRMRFILDNDAELRELCGPESGIFLDLIIERLIDPTQGNSYYSIYIYELEKSIRQVRSGNGLYEIGKAILIKRLC